MQPHKCPVCEGGGEVNRIIYDPTAMYYERCPCRACTGTGVIWEPSGAAHVSFEIVYGLDRTTTFDPSRIMIDPCSDWVNT